MNLDTALSAHAEWKLKLRHAINSREMLDAGRISADNCCQLGCWLHGEAKGKFGASRPYLDLVAKHAAFHVEAGKVAYAINAQRYDEAARMLDPETPYLKASAAVGLSIIQLKQELQKGQALSRA